MLFGKKNANQEAARQLLKLTDIRGALDIIKKKAVGRVDPVEKLKIVLAVGTVNLLQTLKADPVSRKVAPDDRDKIVREFVLESLRKQDLVAVKEGAEMEGRFSAIMAVVGELQKFWAEETDPADPGPGPRYYCVKEMLKRLGGEKDYELHDSLFELMYLRHKQYLDFFKAYPDKTA